MKVIGIWNKVDPLLPLQNLKTVTTRIQRLCFIKAKENERNRMKPDVRRNWEASVDKLFDICLCSCALPSVPCSKSCLTECVDEHFACRCTHVNKVADTARAYLRDQRNRCGNQGTLQLGKVNKKVSVATNNPKPTASSAQLSQVSSSSENVTSSDSEDSEPEKDDPDYHQGYHHDNHDTIYNMIHTPKFAMELIRNGVSTRRGASLANALLLDLHDIGLLNTDPANIILDKCKVYREMRNMKNVSTSITDPLSTGLVCIGVDVRRDANSLIY